MKKNRWKLNDDDDDRNEVTTTEKNNRKMFVAKEKNCYVLYIICFMKILMYRKTIRIHVAFQKDSVVCSYKRWKKIRKKIIAAKYEKCGNHFSTCLSLFCFYCCL